MDIKEFVKTTLRELSEALSESSSELGKKIELTNTTLRVKGAGDYGLIDFDLAVDVTKSEESAKNGGLKISIIEGNVGTNKGLISTNVSRIKFTIEANI